MNTQPDNTLEFVTDQVALRELLDSEIVMVGGGEVVICGI